MAATPIGPVPAFPLASLADLKADLGISPEDTSQDTILTRRLASAGSLVESFLGRPLLMNTYIETFRDIRRSFVFEIFPVLAINSVALGHEQIEPPAHGYDVDEVAGILYAEARTNPWQNITFGYSLQMRGDLLTHYGAPPVRIQYSAGYIVDGMVDPEDGVTPLAATLPLLISDAVLATARYLNTANNRDLAVKSWTEQGVGQTVFNTATSDDGGLPADMAAILRNSPYMKTGGIR